MRNRRSAPILYEGTLPVSAQRYTVPVWTPRKDAASSTVTNCSTGARRSFPRLAISAAGQAGLVGGQGRLSGLSDELDEVGDRDTEGMAEGLPHGAQRVGHGTPQNGGGRLWPRRREGPSSLGLPPIGWEGEEDETRGIRHAGELCITSELPPQALVGLGPTVELQEEPCPCYFAETLPFAGGSGAEFANGLPTPARHGPSAASSTKAASRGPSCHAC